jgi:hypothetical protein
MKLFDHMPMGEEGLKEVLDWARQYVEENRQIADVIELGPSEDGRWQIPAVVVTNKSVRAAEKQNAILTMGRHGKERGTRLVAPAVLEFLASDAAREIRDSQTVVVVPVANPEGFVLEEFHSTMHGITTLEKKVWGRLCAALPPDMMFDYHSLGAHDGAKNDRGDMEVILPANTTKWGMDEQIHQLVANRMVEFAAARGWPYEVHTLEDLCNYYFGEPKGRLAHRYMQEKVFLLHIQDAAEDFDYAPDAPGYTNYTCGPAYLRWHTLVFGIEMNHRAIPVRDGLAESGLAPCEALLRMGNERFPWERYSGYPTNLLAGDFRLSIRATGATPAERRASREKVWAQRASFNILNREMLETGRATAVVVGYSGDCTPLDCELCLRMRQKHIGKVTVEGRDAAFEAFRDDCSTFVSVPLQLEQPGVLHVTIEHELFGSTPPLAG